MMKKALAVLTLGTKSQEMWECLFRFSWDSYAERHGYEIVQVTDDPDPQSSLHPSWKKLLILESDQLADFDRIVYLDHDIVINPEMAPCVVADMRDADGIGVVSWSGSLQRDPAYLENGLRRSWSSVSERIDWLARISPRTYADLNEAAGFGRIDDSINPGVMVLRPEHAPFLRRIYEQYGLLDKPVCSKEMAAVTYELCHVNRAIRVDLDARFNVIFDTQCFMQWPWMMSPDCDDYWAYWTTMVAYQNSFFLHFVNGSTRSYARFLIPQSIVAERKEELEERLAVCADIA